VPSPVVAAATLIALTWVMLQAVPLLLNLWGAVG
jgi:hypothetical protein